MKIFSEKKGISISARKVKGFGKISGLMFKGRNTENLLFDFDRETKLSIHSFFVFFSFYAIWLDEKNKIMEMEKVEPFSFDIRPREKFYKLLEIPINNKNKKIIKFLDEKGKDLNTT